MNEISPRITIDGVDVDYLDGAYNNPGNLSAATLTFKLPLTYGGMKKLWNKEVCLYLNKQDSTPLFRGWIKRTNLDFNEVEIFAQDIVGYMLLGGSSDKAVIALTEEDNLDGLSAGAAIIKALLKAKLDTKLGTAILGNTTPVVSSVRPPLRGTMSILEIIKALLSQAIDTSGTLPRPNIARIIDNGSISQLVIELEADLDSDPVVHIYDERTNISELNIINKKVPTIVVVNGKGGVKGTFAHDSAIAAYDRTYLEVTNESLESPAECKSFAQELFRANLHVQYEYGLQVLEGAYLNENDVIRIQTDNPKFSGNYRVIGKTVSFSPTNYSVGLSINRKPPTLAEYISSRDN